MGSHGGGTVEGQTQVLHHLGLDEAAIGAPFRITSEAVAVGVTPGGHTLYTMVRHTRQMRSCRSTGSSRIPLFRTSCKWTL